MEHGDIRQDDELIVNAPIRGMFASGEGKETPHPFRIPKGTSVKVIQVLDPPFVMVSAMRQKIASIVIPAKMVDLLLH